MSKARDLADLGNVTARLDEVGNTDGALSNRNLIINGAFQVSQRGNYTSPTTTASATYYLDRWFVDRSGVDTTIQQTTGNDIDGMPAVAKAAKLVATASSGSAYLGIRQKIENPSQYEGRTFTYSAYVKSNSTNARIGTFIDGATDLQFVSDGHSGNGQWERLSITFTITNSSVGAWYLDAFVISNTYNFIPVTSGEYIEITGVQLEVGDTATPFEHRSYAQELFLCQRYYKETYLEGVTTSFYTYRSHFYHHYVPAFRVQPSVSVSWNGVNNRIRGYSSGAERDVNSIITGGQYLSYVQTTTTVSNYEPQIGYFKFDAEL